MTVEVLDPGFLTTVQDLGRLGFERYGVPVSGAMDTFALRAANLLVGNQPDAAGLEFTAAGPILYAWHDCLVALGGYGFALEMDGTEYPSWMAVLVRQGGTVRLIPNEQSGWGYLAVSGGILVPEVMGSRSTYLRGGFGGVSGRKLAAGDLLPVPQLAKDAFLLAGSELGPENRPRYNENPIIRVVLGPQADAFSKAGLFTFVENEYILSETADRMGYRFEGPEIEHQKPADILSDGIALGAVQVPANGKPIVMMSDRQTTGGYTKIANVISADLPLLAQCQAGISRVHFKVITVEEAQAAYREIMRGLSAGIIREDETLRFWQS
jgi:antagonist of KipI